MCSFGIWVGRCFVIWDWEVWNYNKVCLRRSDKYRLGSCGWIGNLVFCFRSEVVLGDEVNWGKLKWGRVEVVSVRLRNGVRNIDFGVFWIGGWGRDCFVYICEFFVSVLFVI